MAVRDERKGENESFFRELNERLESHAAASEAPASDESFRVVCECATEECTVRLRVPFAEYESVRAGPRQFIVARGHSDPRVERVVSSWPGFDVVEKFGEAGEVAADLDPRG